MSTDNGGTMDNQFTNRDLIKRAPSTPIVIAATVAFVVLVAAFVVLIVAGKDTQSLADLVGRVVSMLGALLGAGGLAYSASAARSAAAAQRQTNGSLDPRMRAAVGAELDARLTDAVHAGIARALDNQPAAPAPAMVKLQPGDTIPGSYPYATVPDGPVPPAV